MCNMLKGSTNASVKRKRKKRSTSNNTGKKLHTANIILTNGPQERLQNGQLSPWESCPINSPPLLWNHYLVLRDLCLQKAKTSPPAMMWRCRMMPYEEQWAAEEPLVEPAPSVKKTRLCSMRLKCLRHKSSGR